MCRSSRAEARNLSPTCARPGRGGNWRWRRIAGRRSPLTKRWKPRFPTCASRAAQAEARRRAVADAGQVLDLSQKRYLEGATNYFDVVDAQRSRLGAELNGVQTLEARFAATVALVRAIGGGWTASDAKSVVRK